MDDDGAQLELGPAQVPAVVRHRLVELASQTLDRIDGPQTPPALRRVKAFAANRRAKVAGPALAAALDADEAFRARVANTFRDALPELAVLLEQDAAPPVTVDPQDLLVGLLLIRPPGWQTRAGDLARDQQQANRERGGQRAAQHADEAARALAGRTRRAEQEAARLVTELTRARDELGAVRRQERRLRSEADRERSRARSAQGRCDQALAELATARARVQQLEADLEQERRLAGQARDQDRAAARQESQLATVRARLLLDTLVESAAGLRRELALPPVLELAPADSVQAAAEPPAYQPSDRGHVRGRDADDPGPLAELVRLPRAHLVVDGYNVTKTGYGELPLLEQRRRLTDGLAGLIARAGCEVTCCFDGAELEGARGPSRVRGVRVLFSAAGTTADELIRRLVRAEPRGRVLVVVSSDREVAEAVVRSGARAVSSAALLALLARR